MLRFVAPDIQTNGSQQILPGAYLIGPDSVPIAGEVLAEDGLIRCEKGTREAASLALQVDLDSAKLASIDHQGPIIDDILLRPLGVWSLQTCLLPDRDRAYLLPRSRLVRRNGQA